jgi:hypothetical protein
MALITVDTYKDEAGVQSNPAIQTSLDTHCFVTGQTKKKKFAEVFIHWDGAAWVEDPAYIPFSSIPALKVTNTCNDSFSYIKYSAEDFRLSQLCCESVCAVMNWSFVAETPGSFQILINGNPVVNRTTDGTGSIKLNLGDAVQIIVGSSEEAFLDVTNSIPSSMISTSLFPEIDFDFEAACLTYTVTARSNILP